MGTLRFCPLLLIPSSLGVLPLPFELGIASGGGVVGCILRLLIRCGGGGGGHSAFFSLSFFAGARPPAPFTKPDIALAFFESDDTTDGAPPAAGCAGLLFTLESLVCEGVPHW